MKNIIKILGITISSLVIGILITACPVFDYIYDLFESGSINNDENDNNFPVDYYIQGAWSSESTPSGKAKWFPEIGNVDGEVAIYVSEKQMTVKTGSISTPYRIKFSYLTDSSFVDMSKGVSSGVWAAKSGVRNTASNNLMDLFSQIGLNGLYNETENKWGLEADVISALENFFNEDVLAAAGLEWASDTMFDDTLIWDPAASGTGSAAGAENVAALFESLFPVQSFQTIFGEFKFSTFNDKIQIATMNVVYTKIETGSDVKEWLYILKIIPENGEFSRYDLLPVGSYLSKL